MARRDGLCGAESLMAVEQPCRSTVGVGRTESRGRHDAESSGPREGKRLEKRHHEAVYF